MHTVSSVILSNTLGNDRILTTVGTTSGWILSLHKFIADAMRVWMADSNRTLVCLFARCLQGATWGVPACIRLPNPERSDWRPPPFSCASFSRRCLRKCMSAVPRHITPLCHRAKSEPLEQCPCDYCGGTYTFSQMYTSHNARWETPSDAKRVVRHGQQLCQGRWRGS